MATASSPKRGCLAPISRTEASGPPPGPLGAVSALTPFRDALYRALARMKSRAVASSFPLRMSSARVPTRVDRSRSTRAASRSSSSDISRHALHRSTVEEGSMNSVAPVLDASCTMPGTRWRISVFTWTTSRSPRTEMTWSCSASRPVADWIMRVSADATSS